jgi:hypothetical protein
MCVQIDNSMANDSHKHTHPGPHHIIYKSKAHSLPFLSKTHTPTHTHTHTHPQALTLLTSINKNLPKEVLHNCLRPVLKSLTLTHTHNPQHITYQSKALFPLFHPKTHTHTHTQALTLLTSINKNLPKEVLHNCLRPVLKSVQDYRLLTLASLQGLLRILASLSQLSSRLFNVNFPEKLLEHVQVGVDVCGCVCV